MSKVIARIAAAAVIALVGAPLVAVGAANAAETALTRIQVSKFELSSAEGAAAFNARLNAAERAFCVVGQTRSLADRTACRKAVRAEAMEKLSPQQRLALSGQTFSVAQR